MDGILLIDKPAGWTSHDVVAKVRSLLRQELRSKNYELSKPHNSKFITHNSIPKVGHTGTLDPFATGLLILVLGSYTKKAAEFSKLDKTYEAELTLGATSTTGDIEGEITQKSTQKPTKEAVEAVLDSFLGQIMQTPHQYSAIKVGGQRAYKMARQGKDVKLEPRQVTVYRLQVTEYKYPQLKIVTEVSSGTYVRSLAEDIGQKLGTGAYLSSLRRTKIGDFMIENSLRIDGLSLSSIHNHLQK